MAKFIGARVYHSVNLSIANNTLTAHSFDSERFDTDTIHDNATNNSRLTCNTAGKYVITGCINFAANATGIRQLRIQLNGATDIALVNELGPLAGTGTGQVITTIYQLSATDYVELMVQQTSGGPLNSQASANYAAEFSMHRIG